MREKINKLLTNPLVSGSAIIFVGTFISNVFNFLFNFYMTRNLSVVDYGTLASLVSIILLCSLASESFIPTVIHFAGMYFAKNDSKSVVSLYWKLNKFFAVFGGTLFLLFIAFREQIGHFFKIDNFFLISLVGLSVFFSFLAALNRGIILARLLFGFISFTNFITSAIKLLSGIILVWVGLRVAGAVWAFLVSFTLHYTTTLFPLNFLLKEKSSVEVISLKKILTYGMPSAIAMLSLTLFITTDIILVKHFYPPQEAGIYAGMSLLGRIIYFFSLPVSTVLFPIVVQKHTKQERHEHLFYLSLLLVVVASFSITLFYFFFPEFSILILLKQKEYLVIKTMLWMFGIYITFYSILFLVTNYYLSMHKTKVFLPVTFASMTQALLLWFYHDSFETIITISIFSVILPLLFILFHYYKRVYAVSKSV